MSLLRQARGLPESNEELKHEGVMDIFKSKNIKISKRLLEMFLKGDPLDHDWGSACNFLYELKKLNTFKYDNETTKNKVKEFINKNRSILKDFNQIFKTFLSGSKNTIIIDKENGVYNIAKKYINKRNNKSLGVSEFLNGYISIFIYGFRHSTPFGLIENNEFEDKDITESYNLVKKFLEEIEKNKELEITTDKITVESAINQDWLDTQTAIQNFLVTAEGFTTESASNFISNVKTFFTNSIMGISNAISNFMKSYTLTDKYFKDNVTMLNSKNSVIGIIINKKFYDIENIQTKCVVGMKLNYVGTTKELKVFLSYLPEIKTSIDKVSGFIENLYNNHNDARLSNITVLNSMTDLRNKTTNIISELIDGKSIKEDVTIGNLFPNSNSIKLVKEDLLDINHTLVKADVDALNASVTRLTSVLTLFLKEIGDNEPVYSKSVINSLQYSVKEIADVVTNFGTFLVLSNQFTSYYITTLDVVNDAIKAK